MLGSSAGGGGGAARGAWPLASAPVPADPFSRYGVYSLFPGAGSPAPGLGVGPALYHHQHKVTDALFASSPYGSFGAPTPPPGSPYSPVPVTQLELLAKGISTSIAAAINISTTNHSITTSSTAPTPKKDPKRCCWLKPCSCHKASSKTLPAGGCSRTNPVDWAGSGAVAVKREPTQVAEVTTSQTQAMVKMEAEESHQVNVPVPVAVANGNIPVGIAVARQRLQQDFPGPAPGPGATLPPQGLLTPAAVVPAQPLKEMARIQDMESSTSVGGAMGLTVGGANANILQCSDDRAPGLAAWPMGGASTHATPTLWQYPAPMSVEPMLPLPIPVPPLGYQLVRDPSSGHFLLIPTASLEQLGQAVVWPSYPPSSHVLLPPPPPLAPLQLAGDFLATSSTLHQQSTRLLALAAPVDKPRAPAPRALIKLEAEAALDPAPPLLLYQLEQPPCKSQATSPVVCLTPPPETVATVSTAVQDASNQTEQEEPQVELEPEVTLAESVPPPETPEVKLEESNQPDPDISGLELLSNSIVEFEKSYASPVKYEAPPTENGDDVLKGIAHMTLKDTTETPAPVDDNLGGLGLLCALAEQRFMEEVVEQRKEKRKTIHDSKEPKVKRSKYTEENDEETNNNCSCGEPNNNKPSNWSPAFMSAVERDMRQELADLQRRCKEKKLELSKLTPPNEPALLTLKPTQDLLKPPVLNPVSKPEESSPYKRKLSLSQDSDSTSTSTTPEKVSSSKKRKVGRPKKLMTTPGLSVATTETIVAKKPRAKAGLVGYILAAKNRLQMQHKAMGYRENSPPRYSEDTMSSPASSPVKVKPAKNGKNVAMTTTSISSPRNISSFTDKSDNRSKIRPKLTVEPTLKSRPEASSSSSESSDNEEDPPQSPTVPLILPDTPEASSEAPAGDEEEDDHEDDLQEEHVEEDVRSEEEAKCVLTSQHLSVDKLRVLTAMGGLFYAGQLTAVRAPDVYAITLDGERGNRPHIMCREEILRDAIVEVSPSSTSALLPGTRLCAYWSQQYRCLYPGTVADPGSPDPHLDARFVCVEFDDGDSGRIALEDIRLLPNDYPIIEYDPNPLLSLSKRRRRTSVNSVTEERRLSTQKPALTTVTTQEAAKPPSSQAEKENTDINRQIEVQDTHRERKRLKKRRKEKLKKLLNHEDKKKKRKHRCCDEKCKHRKHHKKHRKHKKHHHRSEADENQEVVEQSLPVAEEQVEPAQEATVDEEDEEEDNVVPKMVENKTKKSKKKDKERRESVESRSKMAAFLPARQLWSWSGRGYKRVGVKGRARKQFFKSIQRGKESIMVGDCAVFLSTGRPDRPYIGKIEAMWESWGTNMVVRVKWFYHPEETVGCPLNLKYPGALFESPHIDENDVQTISHKCEVLPLKDYTGKLGPEPQRYETIYDNNDIYYLAGYYDPTTTTLTMKPEIPFSN